MTDESTTRHAAGTTASPSENRTLRAVIVGLIVAVPIGAALSVAGPLVMYLGIFFFALMGLLLGAAMFRVWRPARPVERRTLVICSCIVGLSAFAVSLFVETLRFPSVVVNQAHFYPVDPTQRASMDNVESIQKSHEQRKAAVRDAVRSDLKKRFPPGGMIGYLWWGTVDGKMKFELEGERTPIIVAMKQSRVGFPVRVILSAVLICLAVLSQVWPLRRSEAEEAAATAVDEDADAESVNA